MAKIIGNPTLTPVMPADWNQTDEKKVDYIKNKPDVVTFADIAKADKAGVVKVDGSLGASGLWIENGNLTIFEAMDVDIECRQPMAVITASNFDYAMKFFGDGYYATAEEVGDISSALDAILAIQNELIGGDSE